MRIRKNEDKPWLPLTIKMRLFWPILRIICCHPDFGRLLGRWGLGSRRARPRVLQDCAGAGEEPGKSDSIQIATVNVTYDTRMIHMCIYI